MKKVSNEFINLSKKVKTQDLNLTINDGELTVQEVHFMPVNIFNSIPISRLRARKEVIAKELKYSFEGQLFKTIMQQIEITVKNASEIKGKKIDFKYGILINNEFEYVDMGEYYIKDVEDDKNKEELVVTGYDKMLNFMKPFKQSDLKLKYPCKMGQLVSRMGEVCGVELYSADFYNSDLIVDEDFFTIQELTYRDVLEKVAQTTLTTIFIKENKLYLCKIGESVQTLDTSFLSNLVIGEKFGPVNALVLGRGSVEDNIESVDQQSININGRCEIRFDENEFVDNKREQVIDGMLQQINGLEYYAIEASNLGILWLDPCDVIITKDREESKYKTIYLKASVTINTGIKGEMEADIPEETATKYKVTTKEEKKTLKVERLAKKNEGIIEDVVQQVGDRSEKSTSVTQDLDGITEKIQRIEKSAITSVVVEYALSDSTTTEPQGGWNTTAPKWQEGKYMWQRTVTTYEDETVVTGKAVCIAGATGQQGIPGTNGKDGINGKDGTNGINGKDGKDGINGKDGISNYVHIKYSSVANPTDSQITEIPDKYIGICVNTTVEDPTTASSYIWSKFEGKDGINGINGKNGIDGSSAYVHFAYSTSADGKNNFSKINFAGATYIGVLTDNVEEDSSDYTKYAWSLIKGDKGIGINKVETQYYLSTSKTTQTGGSWKTTQDTWKEGTYYWIRTKITYDNNNVEYTTPILNEDTNSLRESVTTVKKTAEGLETEVKKKLGITELGTQIEQNWEHVKVAWNQISEFIQMEILNGNASLAFRKDVSNLLMALDKLGQHFYKDGNVLFGDIGVNTDTDNKQYLSFSTVMDYGKNIDTGMAWGVKTTSDNKFHPIMYLKNYNIVKNGENYGQLELSNCDLILIGNLDEGSGGAIRCGSIIMGGSANNGLKFIDEYDNNFLELSKGDGSVISPYDAIRIFDLIELYKNSAGSNTFKIGESYITSDGSIYGTDIGATNATIIGETIKCYGHIYCNNGVESFSTLEKKKNIKKYNKSALKEVLNTDIYYFNYKEDNDKSKARIGAVIGKGYKCSKDILSQTKESISDYSMISIAYKAIQEQQEQIEELKEKDKQKDQKIQDLIKRIEALEKGDINE